MMKRRQWPDHTHPLARALLYTIILFAVVHLTISFFVGMLRRDATIMNMFHILGLDLLWPELGRGYANAFLAAIMLVIVWAGMAYRIIIAHKKHVPEKSKK